VLGTVHHDPLDSQLLAIWRIDVVSLIPDPLLFALRRVNPVLVVAETLRRQVGLAFVPERPAGQLLCNRSILIYAMTTSSARARCGHFCSH
jgi:hypothetical protein